MSYDAVSHGGTGGEGGEACIKYVSMGSVTSSETRPRKDCKLEKRKKLNSYVLSNVTFAQKYRCLR